MQNTPPVLYVAPQAIVPNEKNPRYITDANFEKLVQSLIDFPEMLAYRPLVCVTHLSEQSTDATRDVQFIPLGGNMRSKAFPVAIDRVKKTPA